MQRDLRSARAIGWVHAHGAALVELFRAVDATWILFGLWAAQEWLAVGWDMTSLSVGFAAIGLFTVIASQWPLYRSWRAAPMSAELARVIQCWAATMLLLAVALFLVEPWPRHQREIVLTWAVAAVAPMLLLRIGIRLALRAWRASGRNFRAAAILGANDTGRHLGELIDRNAWMGVALMGYFDDRDAAADRTDSELEVRGGSDRLLELVHAGQVDMIYVTLPLRAELRIGEFIDRLRDTTATVMYVPDFSAFGLLRARWEILGGMPMVSLVDSPHRGVDGAVKRSFDILASSLALALLCLPMMAIALAIRLESPGPVIFKQRRYGLDGRPFEIYKFRSMHVVEDGLSAVSQARKADPRVTRLGALLRRTSLDELPQLLNVLQGRMSMVGPRPHPVALNERHRKLIDGYMLRHKVRPGITGWAQVNGFRGETDTPEKMENRIRHDLEYIDKWTIGMDVRILWMTVFRVFDDPNAY